MSIKKNPNRKLIKKLEKEAEETLTLGSLLRSIRLGEDITQVEFADILGISKQYLCDLEKGRKFVSPRIAAEYAHILGYSERQFIRLCLQDLVYRDGFDLIIHIEAA